MMSEPLKIAVFGSNSFSGASFVDYALKQGAHVLGMSRSEEPHSVFLPYRWSGEMIQLARRPAGELALEPPLELR